MNSRTDRHAAVLWSQAAPTISSLEKNPARNGNPASARQPISISDARLGQHALQPGHLPHVQLAGHRVHDHAGRRGTAAP